ncbi:MAG TPA: M2 family metallopeptidase, partial [Terriglobus sp.]
MRISSVLLACSLAVSAVAQKPSTAPPTVAEAKAFLDRANAALLKAATDGSHAEWLAETYINEDSEATTALLNEQSSKLALDLIAESHRYDKLTLPAPMRRQMMLLQVGAPAAPHDPKLLAEETKLAASLTGAYGKGKFCPTPDKCMSVDDVDTFMAKTRDANELTKVWVGWHSVGVPMRKDYERFIELQNIGAKEQGYKDTGDLWRAGYDMTPAQFSAEVNRAWTQLEPLYRELHTYVRHRLIAKYGAAADRKDGMIPAQLLGNTWAQEWGNIYDIVGPADPKLAQFKPVDLEAALIRQIGDREKSATQPYFQCMVKSAGDAKACGDNSDTAYKAHLVAANDMVKYGESFFTSLGFAPLPKTFWERSQFVHPRDRDVVCHASAWDVDQVEDLRVKMCIEVNDDYFTTVHHELGHNFYQRAYNRQPMIFRGGANDGFHEAIGDAIALSITPAYLKQIGLTDSEPPA